MSNDTDYLDDLDFAAAEGAENARERAKETGGVGFRRTYYLSSMIKGGPDAERQGENKAYVRYLSEFRKFDGNPESNPSVWITIDHHGQIPTKAKPEELDKDRKWPKAMGCVCRKGKAFARKYGGKCHVCDNVPENMYGKKPRPTPRTWAVGVLREKIVGDGSEELGGPSMKGRTVTFQDKMEEVHKVDEKGEIIEGETEMVPVYFFAHQAYDNFFGGLAAAGEEYGTVLDRDYLVVREGEGTATNYQHVPQDPVTFDDGSGKQVRLDLSVDAIRETLYPDAPDVRKEIARQASDDYMNQWFIEGKGNYGGSKDKSKSKSEDKEADAPASANKSKEATADRLAALRNRITTSAKS